MLVLHLSTFVMGALSIFAALAMIQVKSALDVWWKLAGIFSGGMLGLFLLGLLSRRATSKHAAIGVAAGVTVIAWMTLSPLYKDFFAANHAMWLVSPFHDNMIIVVGTLTILLVGLVVSRFAKRQIREDRQRIDPEIIGIKELAT